MSESSGGMGRNNNLVSARRLPLPLQREPVLIIVFTSALTAVPLEVLSSMYSRMTIMHANLKLLGYLDSYLKTESHTRHFLRTTITFPEIKIRTSGFVQLNCNKNRDLRKYFWFQ